MTNFMRNYASSCSWVLHPLNDWSFLFLIWNIIEYFNCFLSEVSYNILSFLPTTYKTYLVLTYIKNNNDSGNDQNTGSYNSYHKNLTFSFLIVSSLPVQRIHLNHCVISFFVKHVQFSLLFFILYYFYCFISICPQASMTDFLIKIKFN